MLNGTDSLIIFISLPPLSSLRNGMFRVFFSLVVTLTYCIPYTFSHYKRTEELVVVSSP